MGKTAGEAGWRVSRYNVAAKIPDSDRIAVANLFRGTCGAYTPIELFLLDEIESLDENHPILKRFKERGLIVNFDERAAMETKARVACAGYYGLSEEEALADRQYVRDHWITARRMIFCLNTLNSEPERFPTVIDHLLNAQPERYFRLQEDRWPIAQKYGAETVNARWLSTAGIVFVPERPFLLVVMTRSAPKPEEVISQLCVSLGDYALTLRDGVSAAGE